MLSEEINENCTHLAMKNTNTNVGTETLETKVQRALKERGLQMKTKNKDFRIKCKKELM